MKRKKSIVYLGYHSFPYGLAEVQKIILISKSLLLTGNKVTIIGRNGTHNKKDHPELTAHGFYENIEYIYASGSSFRDEKFLNRRLWKIKGFINEIRVLRKRKKKNELDYAILSTRSFSSTVYYSILAKLIGFKTILNYVEYYSAMKKKPSEIGKRLNDSLFDKYGTSVTSATFLISEFLINHMKKVSPDKKYLKIPGLTDFEKYNGIEFNTGEKYFLYCGAAGYKEIIKFCIDAFGILKSNRPSYLYLVINGTDADMQEVKNYINSHLKKDLIKVYSKLSEKQLYTYYKNAAALLIPLRPTFQDFARFPHKTGEYLASGNPVISTNYGEMKIYFKDMENMFLAESYDVNQFAEKMQFVIDEPEKAEKIGQRGKSVASRIFDYRNVAKEIDSFLEAEL
ncbi:MAG: glycosyltransferase [Bacteroidetes bacterium]|nr:glycosyltransferase [Bacteroidota bacterium]